jgi:hypothetical protein
VEQSGSFELMEWTRIMSLVLTQIYPLSLTYLISVLDP